MIKNGYLSGDEVFNSTKLTYHETSTTSPVAVLSDTFFDQHGLFPRYSSGSDNIDECDLRS